MIVAFTGHRPPKIGGYSSSNPMRLRIKAQLTQLLKSLKPDKAISGMALGVDQDAFEVCLALGIPVIAAIPFEGQEKVWPPHSQEVYRKLLDQADTIVYTAEPGYSSQKMRLRNQWMVDNCDVLIAVWDGSEGGTGSCVKYAGVQRRETCVIDPSNWVLSHYAWGWTRLSLGGPGPEC